MQQNIGPKIVLNPDSTNVNSVLSSKLDSTLLWEISEEDSILVGRITSEKDNPSLTVREVDGKNPLRLVIDKSLKLTNNLNLFNSKAKTIIFNSIKSECIGSNEFVKTDFKSQYQI